MVAGWCTRTSPEGEGRIPPVRSVRYAETKARRPYLSASEGVKRAGRRRSRTRLRVTPFDPQRLQVRTGKLRSAYGQSSGRTRTVESARSHEGDGCTERHDRSRDRASDADAPKSRRGGSATRIPSNRRTCRALPSDRDAWTSPMVVVTRSLRLGTARAALERHARPYPVRPCCRRWGVGSGAGEQGRRGALPGPEHEGSSWVGFTPTWGLATTPDCPRPGSPFGVSPLEKRPKNGSNLGAIRVMGTQLHEVGQRGEMDRKLREIGAAATIRDCARRISPRKSGLDARNPEDFGGCVEKCSGNCVAFECQLFLFDNERR